MPTSTFTTLQICSYAVATDTYTVVLDLNDRTAFYLNELKLDQPEKTYVRASTLRVPGEQISKVQYKNRKLQASLWIKGASTNALLTSIRSFLAAAELPPYWLRIALPGTSTQYSYIRVVGIQHTITNDASVTLAGAIKEIQITFECDPTFRGNLTHLQNLVCNPGFETNGTSQTTCRAFYAGPFTDTNAFNLITGSALSASGNAVNVPSGSVATFGSAQWGEFATFQVRFTFATGLTASFYLNWQDANNNVVVRVTSTSTTFVQRFSSVDSTLLTLSYGALTNGTAYWIVFGELIGFTQGTLTLANDSAGTVGTTIATGSASSAHRIYGLGPPGVGAAGATLSIGGAATAQLNVYLWAPECWQLVNTTGNGISFGNYQYFGIGSGIVASPIVNQFGQTIAPSRMQGFVQLPPVGASACQLVNEATFTTPNISSDIANNTGGTIYGVSCVVWAKASPSFNGTVSLTLNELDNTYAVVHSTTVGTVSGGGIMTAPTGYKIAGTVTTQLTGTAYVQVVITINDGTGISNKGVVYIDQVQCWNQTAYGASMPYCALRFGQSPAQLLVTGLLGDVPTAAALSVSGYLNSWNAGQSFSFVFGRRAKASRLASLIFPLPSPQGTVTYTNDATAYSGATESVTGLTTWSVSPGTDNIMQGLYHLYQRVQSLQATGNLGKVSAQVVQFTSGGANVYSTLLQPVLATGSTWYLTDIGFFAVPATSKGGLIDLSALTFVPSTIEAQWVDTNGAPAAILTDWIATIPVDGGVVGGTAYNGSLATNITNTWFAVITDGTNPDSPGTGYIKFFGPNSVGFNRVGYGIGTSGASSIVVNPTMDSYLTLDPTVFNAETPTGTVSNANQFACVFAPQSTLGVPVYCELAYYPQYLYPR